MNKNINVKQMQKLIDEENTGSKELLSIIVRPLLDAKHKGVFLNEGYDFKVNGSLPEIADAIVKLALELDNQDFGKGSTQMFIELINQYYQLNKNK